MNVFVLNTKEDILKNEGNRAVFFSYYWSQWCPKTAWLQTFFRISSFVFRTNTFRQVWSTWGWVNDERIFIFGWTVPLRHCLRNFVFSYSSSFPIKMLATDAKRRKSNLIRIFYDGRKFQRHDWHNVRSYLFFNVQKFWTPMTFTVDEAGWRLGLLDYVKNHNQDYFGQYSDHDYLTRLWVGQMTNEWFI